MKRKCTLLNIITNGTLSNITRNIAGRAIGYKTGKRTADQSVAVNTGVDLASTLLVNSYARGGVIMTDETEFALYVPVVSKAGGYDNRPLLDGKGEVTAYISFEMAERKGKSYIDSQPEFEALSMQLSVAVLMPGDITKSLLMDEDWTG
jgi:hypothetical protein